MELLKTIKEILYISRLKGKDLLESSRTKVAHIEFTSRCNLKCVFCYASQPEYKGTDLDKDRLDDIIEVLKSRYPKIVSVNGHGETTIYKNWNHYCNKMLDAGIPLHIISNFSKKLSNNELETLSRFSSIEISCDTSDPILFKKLRRGADLNTVCNNISKLRETSTKLGNKVPRILFSCVVSDQNVMNLQEYVSFGISLGISHFNFCNLTKYSDLPHTLNPKHITEMPLDMLEKAQESIDGTFELLRKKNIEFHFQHGLVDSLQQEIQEVKTTPPIPRPTNVVPESEILVKTTNEKPLEDNTKIESHDHNKPIKKEAPAEIEQPHRYTSTRKKSQTRDCLDPWSFILIQSNKVIRPCCWHQPIHTLGKNQTLGDVFNNTLIKKLRQELLTGELTNDCLNCPSRGWTTTDKLKKKVWRYLNPGLNINWFTRIPKIKQKLLKPIELQYINGWYPQESDQNIQDSSWQNWRWTDQKAECSIANPFKDAVLIIRGSVDKNKYKDQKIIFKLNNILLDEFIPESAKFFKEYILRTDMMGKAKNISLQIETNKTFSPSKVNPESNDNRQLGIQIYELILGIKQK